ncbi:MAG TPA: cupin domain-containing protein [Rhodobacterales bacterium]|nr:cupin domain-containing protein [Rhodobacterales bacterium]
MLQKIPRNDSAEFFTRERCYIKELLNDAASPGLSIARCRVTPGVTTELHALAGTAETYLIERGNGQMDDGESPGFAVGPGDSVVIAPDHPQRICNTGTGDLVFLVICTPRFEPPCYQPLERR